jgi:ABC-2 type transport system permease protein
MPWIFYWIGACMPATYFIALMRAIVLRGASLADFWSSLLVLAGMGVGLFALCAVRFSKKIG